MNLPQIVYSEGGFEHSPVEYIVVLLMDRGRGADKYFYFSSIHNCLFF